VAEVAVAEVTVIPVSKGAQKQIEQQLGGEAAGQAVGAKVGAGITSALGSILKGTATTAIAGASASIGAALVGGFARLNNIDVARAKLTGLGTSAEAVQAIMGDALAAVKGTAFGLGDAATVAAGAVAAGIKPGEELQAVLKAVANSAATAGVGLGEMGAIFNKVASTGKAQNDVLQQVADKGIPIYQALADQLGVTAGEVFDLASAGKIGFGEFQAAMIAASGTVAAEMGKTIPGAFANLKASLSRIGAGLLGGVFPSVAPLILGVTSALAPLETRAKAIGDVIGARLNPILQSFTGFLAGANGGLEGLAAKLAPLAPILGPLVGIFAALGASGLGSLLAMIPGLGGLAGPLSALAGPFGLIAAAIAGLIAVSPERQAALSTIGGLLQQTFGNLFTALAPVITQVVGVLALMAQTVGGVLAQALLTITPFLLDMANLLGGVLIAVLPSLLTLLTSLTGIFSAFAGAIVPIIGTVLDAIGPAFASLAPILGIIVQALVPLVSLLSTAIMPIFNALGPIVTTLVSAIAPLIPIVLQLAASLISTLVPIFTQLIQTLAPVISMVVEFASTLISMLAPIITALAPIITQLITAFMPLISAILTTLIQVVAALLPVLQPILDLFIQLLTPILSLIQPLMQLVSAIIPPLSAVLTFLANVIGNVLKGAFAFLIPVIQGVVNMLSSVLGPTINAIVQILNGVITFLTGVFTGDWNKVWKGIGDIFSGIWNGLTGIVKGVVNGIIDLINGVIGGINNLAAGIKSATGGAIDLHIGKIPHLADSGTVLPRPGGTLALVAEAGKPESVVDTGKLNDLMDAAAERGGRGGPGVYIDKVVAPDEDVETSGRILGREIDRVFKGEI